LICTLFIHCINSHFKHLSWHSITKILRNGPRAHFPFIRRTVGYTLASVLQATSTPHVRRPLRSEAVFDELRSNNIFLWWQYCSHGEVFRHSCQECCTNLVLLPSARNNHIMAEVEGYADHQFPRVSNEAGHRSSFIPVHPRS
jgi:hypothetical protein